jgi:hypothetical protein
MIEKELVTQIAGASTILAIVMSLALIFSHFASWTNRKHQLRIVFIILMVPLFAVTSFLGLYDMGGSETHVAILESIRECYEAFVIFSFLGFLYSILDIDPSKDTLPEAVSGRVVHQVFPLNLFLSDITLTPASAKTLRFWAMQFVILRPILSVIEIVADYTGHMEIAIVKWTFTIALNVSVGFAVYSLVMIYHAFEEELSSHRPLAKFMCIKGVVFFAFWQGVALGVLEHFGVLHADHWYTTDQVANGVQNFLVCVEMGFLFSFAHLYSFHSAPYGNKAEQ